MKILIAGFGSIGRRHFRNLRTLGEQDIMFFRSHEGTLPDDEIAPYPVENNLISALQHKPEAVIISNPTSLHLDVAIPAAEAGCHIFIEKPISHSMERVDDFRSAVKSGGGQVLVGFQFRFHPGLQRISRLLDRQTIGRPLSVRAHWGEYLPSWHPWEDYRLGYSARADLGGGVVLTLCHPLDYLRWLLGEVDSLWSFVGDAGSLDLTVEDSAEIGINFVSGVLGSVHLNFYQHPTKHYLEIVTENGLIRWDNADGEVQVYKPDGRSVNEGYWEKIPPPRDFKRNELFLAEMKHFLDVTKGEVDPICTLEDGVRALELALAAKKSAQQGILITVNPLANLNVDET
ncbi:MAG: Gfo/Idh/MocA family oxidoreductase [Anaerolineales bacterium]|jgi:predicted dehydrogenase